MVVCIINKGEMSLYSAEKRRESIEVHFADETVCTIFSQRIVR